MHKKLIILAALLSGISVVAMDHIKEMPLLNGASQHEEESLVNIRLTDAQNSETTHELAIPVRLAKLMGVLVVGLEEPSLKAAGFTLPNVTIVQWQIIEPFLEHVYRIRQDASQAVHLRQEVITEFGKLEVKSLIGVICISDYLEIPILLECACEVVKQSAPDKISWEELEVLPRDIRNQIIMNKAVMLLGKVPVFRLGVGFAVCVTKDGKIVSSSDDNTLRVWDKQGNQLAECMGHANMIKSLCVTEDGKIVSCSWDKTVRVWDMQGNQLAVCRGHEELVDSVCVTKDGKIVSGSRDKTVRVWDMEGNQLAVSRGHEGGVTSVCVSKDGGKIVSCSWDKTVRVWDMQGNQLAVCRGHEKRVYSICIAQDGKIVSCSADKTLRVWDIEGNQLAVCRGHEGIVMSVCVTKDGKIVSGSDDCTVRVWDMQGNQLAVCRGHEDRIMSVCVTKDGKPVSGSWDKTVRVWDMQGNQLALCRGHKALVWSVCVTKTVRLYQALVLYEYGILDY